MRTVAIIGFGVLLLFGFLALIFTRRLIISRGGGTVDMSIRLSSAVAGRGWAAGVGRFVGPELRWYRMFSLALRPRRVLVRSELAVVSKRLPDGAEQLAMPGDCVILCCTSERGPIEIALAEAALTGFLSWLEAAPPGKFEVIVRNPGP